MKVKNMTAGTLVRTVTLVVALLNLVLTSFGKNPLPFSDEQIYTGLSALVTVAPARQMRCCGCYNERAPQRTRAWRRPWNRRVTDVCTLLLPADDYCLQGNTVPQ